MNIIHKDSPFYHIKIEDIFSKNELTEVKKVLNNLKPQLKTPEFTESAEDFSGKMLKKNIGVFLHTLNYDVGAGIITNKVDEIFKKVLNKSKWLNLCFRRNFEILNWGSELIQYYKNGDYYKPHFDKGSFTMVMWLYDNKNVTDGGDFYFPEYDYLYNCGDNNGLIFFSKEIHSVTKLKSDESFGRYSITTFSSARDEKVDKKYRKMSKESNISYN